MPLVKWKRISPHAKIPVYSSPDADGADLFAAIPDGEVIELYPNTWMKVPLGFATEPEPGWNLWILPRSGNALKYGITLENCVGDVDNDYRGEWGVILRNDSGEIFRITNKQPIAQACIRKTRQAVFHEVQELNETKRGAGGYGHTDKNRCG